MSTIAPPRPPRRRTTHRGEDAAPTLLDAYTDHLGRDREVVARPGAAGSTLVIDRLACSGADERLLAHLAPDEPPENASILCALYLADGRTGCCRLVREEDFRADPYTVQAAPLHGSVTAACPDAQLIDRRGRCYRLARWWSAGPIPELRWKRIEEDSAIEHGETVGLRAVVGSFESYEPARSLTAAALAVHGEDRHVSTAALRGELERLNRSRIVLNRGLREALLSAVGKDGLTMSDVAIRCGRTKRDRRGHIAGETSWLSRRVGLAPEGGGERPTQWIHSDTLALIARAGLGRAPVEVELG